MCCLFIVFIYTFYTNLLFISTNVTKKYQPVQSNMPLDFPCTITFLLKGLITHVAITIAVTSALDTHGDFLHVENINTSEKNIINMN